MELVVYGDFNCPYSCLASARADVLVARGIAAVDWRAVEHDPAIPAPNEPVDGELASMLEREVAEVRGLLRPGEAFTIRRPSVHPNTGAAVAAFAASSPQQSPALRQRLFDALWRDGRDIGDEAVLRDLGAAHLAGHGDAGRDRVAAWREQWLGLDRHLVPMLVLPDGYVSRGLGALARLADLAA
jgi:predicted DsbA family dithiol-disulfide isomerase